MYERCGGKEPCSECPLSVEREEIAPFLGAVAHSFKGLYPSTSNIEEVVLLASSGYPVGESTLENIRQASLRMTAGEC